MNLNMIYLSNIPVKDQIMPAILVPVHQENKLKMKKLGFEQKTIKKYNNMFYDVPDKYVCKYTKTENPNYTPTSYLTYGDSPLMDIWNLYEKKTNKLILTIYSQEKFVWHLK